MGKAQEIIAEMKAEMEPKMVPYVEPERTATGRIKRKGVVRKPRDPEKVLSKRLETLMETPEMKMDQETRYQVEKAIRHLAEVADFPQIVEVMEIREQFRIHLMDADASYFNQKDSNGKKIGKFADDEMVFGGRDKLSAECEIFIDDEGRVWHEVWPTRKEFNGLIPFAFPIKGIEESD